MINRRSYNILSLIVLFIFIVVSSNSIYSSSIDLAHHYTLIDNLSKYSSVNDSFGNLREMAFYPNLSHWFAVFLGILLDSNIIGVSYASIISLLVIWLTLTIIILNLKPLVSILTLLLIILFGIFTKFFGAFLGQEIVVGFFYSQLVGEALALSILLLSIFIYNKTRLFLLILLSSSLLIAFFHLLPALQILGFTYLVVLYSIYKTKKIDFINIILLILGLILFLFHPSFEAMSSIGSNNGYLSFIFMPDPIRLNKIMLIILFLSSFSISLYLLFSKKFSPNLSIRFLSLFSLSNSFLMLMQTSVLFFNIGSAYAVKKYVFMLVTLTVIQICIIISMYVTKIIENKCKITFILPKFLIATIVSVIIIFIELRHKSVYSLQNLAHIEKNLKIYDDSFIQNDVNERSIYLDKNNILSYMFSISILEHPRNSFGMKLISSTNIVTDIYTNNISNIITKKNYFPEHMTENLNITNGFNIFKKDSLVKLVNKNLIDVFSKNGLKIIDAPSLLKEGWNNIEPWGVWSAKNKASLFINTSINKRFNHISFTLQSWNQDRNISIKVNNISCGTISVSSSNFKTYTLDCPIDINDKLEINFHVSDWDISPKKLNISEDRRNLGIGLTNIKLY